MAMVTKDDLLALVGRPGMKVRALDVDVFADAVREVYPRVALYCMDKAESEAQRFQHARDLFYTVRRGGLGVLESWEATLPGCIVV